MGFVFDYVKNICCFTLVISIILTIFPDENHKKYIKLFAGFLLILIIFSPIIKLEKTNINLNKILNNNFKEKVYIDKKNVNDLETKIRERVYEKYNRETEKTKNR